MMNKTFTLALVALGSAATLSGCSSGAVGTVAGQVTVDGAPAEIGTITFKPADNPTGKGAGGAMTAGRFELQGAEEMKPGKYLVSAQAMKATGKMLNDPQRGPVPKLQSLTLADSPQEIEVTSANANALTIDFHTQE
jgi:hypothetical protein